MTTNIHIIDLHLNKDDFPSIYHTFKDATVEKLPELMKNFPNDELVEDGLSLFQYLLDKHKKELDRRFGPTMFSAPVLIDTLYTVVLTPEHLIDDINSFDGGRFTVCFENDRTWKIVEKLLQNRYSIIKWNCY
jgi:hypothetical protein